MAMNNSLAEVHPELVSEWSEKNRNRKNKRRKVEEDDNGKVRGKYARLFLSGGDSSKIRMPR